MTFDPGIAIVPASEVARDRRGTCFGYAVLLASLARAVGIPTRIRMGFVYAGGIWGGHAWVDALIADTWVPLDAALYSPGPADAARFSFFTSSLQEGTVAQVGELAKLYGHVDVQVLDYTIRGKTTPVPPDAAAFSISQDTYTNPWLGLTVHKPKSFQFTQTTAIWPDSTIVAMNGPGGRLVEVESASESLPVNDEDAAEELFRKANLAGQVVKRQVAGHQLTVILPDDEAATVLRTGGNVFLVKAKGPGAEQLLSATVSGLTVRN